MTQTQERTPPAAQPPPSSPGGVDETLERLAARLDEAMATVAELDPEARTVVTAALEAMGALHKGALTTVVRRLKDDPAGKPLLFDLVDDPQVRMVLSMHGIIRADPLTAARQVLDGLRPGLQSHGGDVELDGIRDGVAYVRLRGACNGCSMAAVTMRDGVEAALVAGVAGVTSVEVLPNDPTPTLIPLSAIGIGPPTSGPASHPVGAAAPASPATLRAAGWCDAAALDAVPLDGLTTATLRPEITSDLSGTNGTARTSGTVVGVDVVGVDVVVVNAGGQLAAYLNACAHQGLPLDDALVDAAAGTITCPWHGFCYDAASGECLSMPGAQLQQLPLRIEDGRIWVRAVGG